MRVLLTGTARQSARLAPLLRAAGLEPVECPLVELDPLPGGPIDTSRFDWVVLTSRPAVELFLARARGPLPRVAAIGPGTAAALRERGVEPALVPEVSTQEGLVAAFPRPPGRVLFAGAEDARRLVVDALGAEHVVLYRTVERRPATVPEAELAVVASGSAARALARIRPGARCVSIGPATTQAARRAGLDVVREASRSDLAGLAEAVRLAATATEHAS